jgi:hypothetical protein
VSKERIALGHGHFYRFFGWHPEHDINPQYEGIPDIEIAGAIVDHPRPDGKGECSAGIMFEVPGHEVFGDLKHRWQVNSFDPLTVSPSLLCRACGDHGFIREGKWIPA